MSKIQMAEILENIEIVVLKRKHRYNHYERGAAFYDVSLEDTIRMHHHCYGYVPATILMRPSPGRAKIYYYVPMRPHRRLVMTEQIELLTDVPEIA